MKTRTRCRESSRSAGRTGAFKERLLADPAATLAAEGVEIPDRDGATVNV